MHEGFWSRDQFIANGPVPTPEMAAANKKYQEEKARKASAAARNDNTIKSVDIDIQKKITSNENSRITRNENRRRAMEYAQQ